jgi:hypothetical protein
VDRLEPVVVEGGQEARERRHRPEVSHAGLARGADELDRNVQQPFQSLLDEVAQLGVGEGRGAVDGQSALRRQAQQPDRRPAKPVRIARAGRLVAEPEGDLQVVDPLGRREDLPGVGLRQRPAGGIGRYCSSIAFATASG